MATPSTPAQAVSPNIHEITLAEKLDIPVALVSILATTFYTFVTAPFRGESGAYYFGQHVSHALARKLVQRLSTRQLQYVAEPFTKVYEKWSLKRNLPTEYVQLSSGAKAFWLGDHKTAKYIVVYYHGGGFALDGDDNHLGFWHSVQTDLKSSNIEVASLFLEYTLAPGATYPTQICQAVEALDYVLTELKRPASEVLLAGDSAGANLALAVLSHLKHSSPDLPALTLPADQKLKALVLVAPWTSFRLDFPSNKLNEFKDIVSKSAISQWSKDYLGGKESTPYAEAFEAPGAWWKDAKVHNLIAVAGADEVLLDSIKQWFDRYQAGNPNAATLIVAPHEGHIEPIIGLQLGYGTETVQGNAIKSWMKANL